MIMGERDNGVVQTKEIAGLPNIEQCYSIHIFMHIYMHIYMHMHMDTDFEPPQQTSFPLQDEREEEKTSQCGARD